jgi:rhomboid protease GluP
MDQNRPIYDPYNPSGATPSEQGRLIRVNLPKVRPVVTYALLGVTVAIYLLQLLSQSMFGGDDILFLWGGKINAFILQGEVWRFITPIFLHASILHIAFNMYALLIFGPELERAYGHWRYLALYLLGGFAGNVLSFTLSSFNSLGSSTAIFGLVSAEAVFIYQNRNLFGKRARSILLNLLLITVINFALGLTPNSMIDNWGHLGGLLGGAIFAWFAGPKWLLEGFIPAARIVDQRTSREIQLGAVVVIILFGALAWARFVFIK